MGHEYSSAGDKIMSPDLHVIAFRNTYLSNPEGKYALGQLLGKLNFFGRCETLADMELRNTAIDLLEDCGILYVENAGDKYAEKSIQDFVDAIAELDVTPLVEAEAKAIKDSEDRI